MANVMALVFIAIVLGLLCMCLEQSGVLGQTALHDRGWNYSVNK